MHHLSFTVMWKKCLFLESPHLQETALSNQGKNYSWDNIWLVSDKVNKDAINA